MKVTKPRRVFVLFEQDEGSQEMMCAGVFSTRESAEEAHDKFEELCPPHWPTEWRIEEYVIDAQLVKLQELGML